MVRLLTAGWLVLLVPVGVTAGPSEANPAGYMAAIRQELARLDLTARCDDATATCVFQETLGEPETALDLVLQFSQKTDTVYLVYKRYLSMGEKDDPCLPLALRLLELNREMVTAKFEWDRSAHTIRLSAALNTDSNFDRRAFRSLVIGLRTLAKRLYPELHRLAQECRKQAPPPPQSPVD